MHRTFDIIVVNDFAHVLGGADRVALSGAVGLADAGHSVTLFTAVGPVDPAVAAHPRIKVICLGQQDILKDPRRLRAARNGVWNASAARYFRALLREHSTARTLVHVHSYSKALSAAVPSLSARLGFRTILTLHDYFLLCPNGGFFEYPTSELCRRSPLGRECFNCRCDARQHLHKLWRFGRTWWQNRVARLPERLACVIALSALNGDTARPFLPPTTRIALVPNPVEIDRSEPVPVEENDTFVFAGRMETYKGPQLLAAAAMLRPARVVFCGDGSAADEVRRLFPQARITGWLDRERLQAEIARARALVFPSLWPETFGLTVLEALARGVPVIASRGTAAEEQVAHDVNGLLFTRGSASDLAARLQQLEDPGLARRLGRAAHRRYWDAPFTLTRHVEKLEELFASLLPKPQATV